MEAFREIMDEGWRHYRSGDLPGAERAYRRAVEVEPASAEAWYLLGSVAMLRRKADEAESSFRLALKLAPQHVAARNNLGVLLLTRREPVEAAACFREVIRLKPDHADAQSNLGNAIRMLGDVEGSLDCYRRAIELRPDHVDAHRYLGNALQMLGRVSEAIDGYEAAIRLRPDDPEAHLCLGLARLLTGDFARGWSEHEWRFRCPGAAPLPVGRSRWDGSPLEGRTILLYADHGLGDAIQFVRYAKRVEGRGGRTVLACRRPVERLLATCRGVHRVVPEGTPVSDFDVYVPLMSLPGILGTRPETIPAEVPYLEPDPRRVASWRNELGSWDAELEGCRRELRIGIAWQGDPSHGNDRDRSFPLARFEPIARIPGVRLHSLQKGAGSEQIAGLDGRFAVNGLGDRLGDMADTAALMRSLDLVIVPDTSLAHLAGAIAVPVWVALPFAPDSRWMLDRDDSPWYPTMRLFRQRRRGDWDDVFARLAVALKDRAAAPDDQSANAW